MLPTACTSPARSARPWCAPFVRSSPRSGRRSCSPRAGSPPPTRRPRASASGAPGAGGRCCPGSCRCGSRCPAPPRASRTSCSRGTSATTRPWPRSSRRCGARDVLAHGTGILADALARHSAVPAFATYNLEMVQAVVEAAEQTGKPVIVLAGSSHFKHAGRAALMSIALQAAAESSATIGVHLDHCRDLAEMELCVQAGSSSVMVDGSHLPFGQNIELTRAAVALAHPAGAWVEAELGGIPGDEDRSTDAVAAGAMTDPAEAAEFVERT